MITPDHSTAAAFPRYLIGEVVADSVSLKWTGLYARRWRLPRVMDRFLVPATPEPHISCNLRGTAEFRERDVGGKWIMRKIQAGDLFVTRSRTGLKPFSGKSATPGRVRDCSSSTQRLRAAVVEFMDAHTQKPTSNHCPSTP